MADNTTITPGSGVSVASDDIGGVQYQRVKNTWGSDGTAVDVDAANGLPVQAGWKEVTGSAGALNGDVVTADVSGYRWMSLQISGTFVGTITFQVSNDGVTWYFHTLAANSIGVGMHYVSVTAPNLLTGPIGSRYFRARFTAWTSGTATAVLELHGQPGASLATSVVSAPSTAVTGGMSPFGDAASTSIFSFAAPGMGFNGATWDRLRTPAIFKSVTATASGSTAVWTPTSGKKFRLMRYKIDVTQDAAQTTGGVLTIALLDNATDMGLSQSVFVPGSAGTAMGPGWSSGWIDLGNGRASSAINLIMNVNLSAALTPGTVRVVAAGVEE